MNFSFTNNKVKRYAIALSISLAGIGISFIFRPQKPKTTFEQKKELTAIILNTENDVKKKFQRAIIWEEAPGGAPLYKGEVIRTGPDSTSLIRFLKSGARIELEPNTTVILDDLSDGTSLDVKGGSLLVKSAGSKSSDLKIKSGKKVLDVNDAEMSVTLGKNGKLGVQVFKGAASTLIDGQAIELTRKNSGVIDGKRFVEDDNFFRDVRPNYEETVYISTDNNTDSLNFTWAGVDPSYKVVLERGLQRNGLFPVLEYEAIGDTGQLSVPFSIGTYFWRLKAIPLDETKSVRYSKTSKIMVRVKSRPVLVSPYNGEQVYLKTQQSVLSFIWNSPVKLEQQIVEVATDSDFKNKIHQKFLDNVQSYQLNIFTKKGDYYWRVKGVLEKSSSTISSVTGRFTLFFGETEKPPQLITPMHDQIYQIGSKNAYNVDLRWDKLQGVDSYNVTFRGLGERENVQVSKTVTKSSFYIKGLKPGEYEWFVQGIANSGKTSPNSQKRRFTIISAKKITWRNFNQRIEFMDERPAVDLEWQNLGDVEWELQIGQDPTLKQANIIRPFENKWSFIPPSDGRYFLKVIAYNKDNILIARSITKTFNIFKRPLLESPEYLPELPNPVISNKSGIAKVGVFPIERAQAYLLELKNDKGRMVRQEVFEKPIGRIKNLMPGKYNITMQAIDANGRSGIKSDTRLLLVPKGSSIQPPIIKNIKIK